jgi:hypothetical protein
MSGSRGHQIHDNFATNHCRNAQRTGRKNFFFPINSQFALPPDWNAIILPRKVGIGPVGVRPLAKSELPP